MAFFSDNEDDHRNPGIGETESIIALIAAIVVAWITRSVLKNSWRRTFDREPPANPASSEVDWQDALLWGAASGAIIGVSRIFARRAASGTWRRLRH